MRQDRVIRPIVTLVGALVLAGCGTLGSTPQAPTMPALRIGVNADYPPLVFRQGGEFAGLEIDFAERLASALGRQPEFVELRWDRLVPSLMDGQIDIIMSGMSVTRARQLRIDFTDPYLDSGLLALMRIRDAGRYQSRESITRSTARIGVKAGTTGDIFVQKECPRAQAMIMAKPIDAVYELKRGTIDLFIHDAPYVAWLVSANEADFTALWTPLTNEQLAWAVRRGNRELLDAANAVLRRWKEDGTLEAVVHEWLPHGTPAR